MIYQIHQLIDTMESEYTENPLRYRRLRTRSRSWSELSDIIDDELNTTICRWIQVVLVIGLLCWGIITLRTAAV